MQILLDFRTKPTYAPIIDLVNELSNNFDVIFLHNKKYSPVGLNSKVVCGQGIDVRAKNSDIVFSTYSTLLAITYLKMKLKLPIVNYLFIYMMIQDILSAKFIDLPNSYKFREVLKLLALSLPKSFIMPEKLVLPNHMVEKELTKLGFTEDRMVVLPWGLNTARYKPQELSLSSMNHLPNNNENIIVYTGPLHPLRFSTQLLYTFNDIIKQNTDSHLLLLFRKDLWHQRTYMELINEIRRLGLEKKVTIMTSLSYESYLSYVARATVVILPYYSSGIVEMPPFTLLECMALSKPVITSHGMATSSIIKNGINGFKIPEKSFLFTDLINFLLLNKRKARHIGQKARTFVQENYSLTNFSSKLSNVLESCCR